VFKDASTSTELRDKYSRKAKIDGLLLAKDFVDWVFVISVMEFKGSLTDKDSYDKVLGQIHDRSIYLRHYQPNRKFFIGFVASNKKIEFVRFTKDTPFQCTSSGVQSFQVDPENHAFQMLCGLFLCPPSDLGYQQPRLPLEISMGTRIASDIMWFYDNTGRKHSRVASCRVYKASFDGNDVIVKVSESIDKEMAILENLNENGVPGIPKVVSAVRVKYNESESIERGFAMRPVGQRFPNSVDLRLTVHILKGVLQTIEAASTLWISV
jgi:hypothetical protein